MENRGIDDLDPRLNRFPEGFAEALLSSRAGRGQAGDVRSTSRPKVFLLGVGGVAMASLAGLLKDVGCEVSGADEGLYPPMKGMIEELGIHVHEGYGQECLDGAPGLVVVGNVVTRRFPAAAELKRRGIPYLSLPQALSEIFLKSSRNLVVAGCHGKTTLTSLCARLLSEGGLDPGFLIGGASLDFPRPYARGGGDLFVVEGDEYDCAFFDKRPKFVHYRPRVAILTSVEYDHADIYPDLASVRAAFRSLAELVPPDGLLVANGDDPLCVEASAASRGRVELYGEGEGLDWRLAAFRAEGFGSRFTVRGPQGREYELGWPKLGRYNARGACAAVAAAIELGLDPERLPEAFAGFRGVRRRQEPVFDSWAPLRRGDLGPGGVTVVDDFAHHPTAVALTLAALKEAFPGRRLVCCFEPRSNTSRRAIFQGEYAKAFGAADLAILCAVDRPDKAPEGDRLDAARLARDIGPGAELRPDPDAVFERAVSLVRPGDIVCVMSNGAFGGISARLADFFRDKTPGFPPVGV
ncbi:MAG: Mur ligase domain-containing protein [Deltaproteobacteria bacterium]|jgi:UDP-N-acetylmuramate: L-alanyl-gamma-D-glutamyl-meso-diaminopimelate ligase|nr:Mur ligase domain-containing protein [Deltaproteobacteria bacterium]